MQQSLLDFGQKVLSVLDNFCHTESINSGGSFVTGDSKQSRCQVRQRRNFFQQIRGREFSAGINSGVRFVRQIGVGLVQQVSLPSGYVRLWSLPALFRVVGKRECQLT